MANQPTKYRKFIVGAASAALVATAVAPVASAADFKDTKGNTHEEAINALSSAGVIKGYEDGTFQPNKTLTRSDVVKMMGKWLVSEGYSIPSDSRSNPRFSDLKTHSNGELLDYAAVVYDNGVFNGSGGRLLAGDNITRENMAVVLVRAFDTVKGIDLVSYVSKQDFKKDVKDLNAAKSEARPAIDVLDFFDITNPTVANFNPKDSTTRGHFATFLHKALGTDFSKVTGVATADVVSIKAVNATTVEVTFKEAVENVSGFTIEGLTVSNAAVKQSDSKTVVLTTTAQEGGKKYTVALGGKEIGSFEGVSAVIPAKIDITTQSVQGKTGQQAIVSADVGVKQAGIAVTFNVKADTNNTLNKDQVFEAVTNADGIATFSYTQYAAGTDEVVAYPTGAPTVRSHAFVFWGVNTILSVTPQGDKGNSVNNGEDKTYKLTYLDPKTGKPVANQKFFVTFEENLNVNVDKTSKATVNGVNPRQLLNNENPIVAEVTTDAKGEAVFTVSGSNTAVTPIVFMDNGAKDTAKNVRELYEASKLQAKADKVTFAALQAEYTIEIEREGGEEAAIDYNFGGRDYTITVLDKDGKIAANELVNVAFNEDLDRNINTNTDARFVTSYDDLTGDAIVSSLLDNTITVKTNAAGQAYFTIVSNNPKDYATPIAWIDINSSNAKEGKFDDGEPFKIAPITYFAVEKLTDGAVFAYDAAGKLVPTTAKPAFLGNETATFKFKASNQSYVGMDLPAGYAKIDATFTVFNTGANDILVEGKVVSPNRSYTTNTISALEPAISVQSIDDKDASVKVVANGTAQPLANRTDLRPINLGSHSTEVKFNSTKTVGTQYVGIVTGFNMNTKSITFAGKSPVSYAKKVASFYDERAGFSKSLTEKEFNDLVKTAGHNATVRLLINGDNFKFVLTSLVAKPADLTAPTAQAFDTNADGKADSVELTFGQAVNVEFLSASNFSFAGGTVTATNVTSVTGNPNKVKITIAGANGLAVPNLAHSEVLYLGVNGADLLANSNITVTAAVVAPLTAATAAVVTAERTLTQVDLNAAQTLVLALPLGAERTALQNRLNVVQATIDAGIADAAVQAATNAVVAAEASKLQGDVTTAQGLVTALPAGAIKNSLQARIDVVQAVIDAAAAQALVDAVTLTVSTPYALADAGTTVVVDAQAGFTFAITGSDNLAAIDATGKVVAAGTAVLTYTVTHTASGKTATKTVSVTVAP